ncbi:hypothetical protein LX36DRAFT_403239 [Colletotrichum falcatum]|nr:hypothetical protein LX36DRAFT_403239 [Colletotrichum falcatum]
MAIWVAMEEEQTDGKKKSPRQGASHDSRSLFPSIAERFIFVMTLPVSSPPVTRPAPGGLPFHPSPPFLLRAGKPALTPQFPAVFWVSALLASLRDDGRVGGGWSGDTVTARGRSCQRTAFALRLFLKIFKKLFWLALGGHVTLQVPLQKARRARRHQLIWWLLPGMRCDGPTVRGEPGIREVQLEILMKLRTKPLEIDRFEASGY